MTNTEALKRSQAHNRELKAAKKKIKWELDRVKKRELKATERIAGMQMTIMEKDVIISCLQMRLKEAGLVLKL